MSLREEMQKKREQELIQNSQEEQEQIHQSEIDNLNSTIQTLKLQNLKLSEQNKNLLELSENVKKIENEKNQTEQELKKLKEKLSSLQKQDLTSQERDKINKLVSQIKNKGARKDTDDKRMSAAEWKNETTKLRNSKESDSEKDDFMLSEKINTIIDELERERKKPPQIEVREKEIVKLEPKCAKCVQTEYTYKLLQLKFFTYGALAYSIIITIISIVKNDIIRADFKTFFGSAWDFLQGTFQNVNNGFLGLANKIDNTILHWIIYVGLWAIVGFVVGYGIYRLVTEMPYKTWKFWNVGAVGILLVDLIILVFFSEQIKSLTQLNVFIFALLFYAVYIIARIVISFMRKRS